jgi:hypothetical protein
MASRQNVVLAWSVAALLLLGPLCAWSQEPRTISDVRIGLSGHAKHGHWAEVSAVVQAGAEKLEGQLQVVTRDGDGVPVAVVCPTPVNLPSGGKATFSTLVKIGPPRSGIQLRLLQSNHMVAEFDLSPSAVQVHGSTSEVIATLGPAIGVENAVPLMQRQWADGDFAAVPITDPAQLPVAWQAYDAIDCLVISSATASRLDQLADQQRRALLDWIRLGGRLVIVTGGAGEALFAEPSPWSELLPGQVRGASVLKSEAGLRAFTGEPVSLDPSAAQGPSLLQVQVPRDRVALWESGAASGDRPLLVETPFGMGRVSFVLFDLTDPALATWPGRTRFLARALSSEASGNERSAGTSGGRMTHLGYRDLAGQLRSALDQYAHVTPVHFYAVAGGLLVYLLLIGPGEYFLLKKAAPTAMHLTWIVSPLLIVVFVASAIWLGQSSRGETLQVNHMELVDLNTVDGRQRGHFWTGLFSPEAQAFQLSAQPKVNLPEGKTQATRFAWQALPGTGLGGVDVVPIASAFQEPYFLHSGEQGAPATIDRLPLALATSKMLSGSWWGSFTPLEKTSQLQRGRLCDLEGSFRNIAPVALQNAFLAHGEWLYRARDEIAPGATINIDRLERKHLEYQLTQRRVLETQDMATPWNQEEADVSRILNIMMFHQAVRGRSYTVLSHDYQPELDFSHLIKRGYAVLVGRAETPLVELKNDGQPFPEEQVRRWTYYRIIYPVASPPEVADAND